MIVRLVMLPPRAAVGTTALTLKTGARAARLVGYRRLALLGIGVTIGLLVAPVPGRELRARIHREIERRRHRLPDAELAERVRFELSHAPRTWHLPQPEVSAIAGRIVLDGEVGHETARADLARAAAAVPGVAAVENNVVITGTSAAG
jgi:hypothetical protein